MPRDMPPAVDVPHLEGWETLSSAAKRLGVSRQRMFVMIRENNRLGKPKLKARRVGDDKPVYIVPVSDVNKILKARTSS